MKRLIALGAAAVAVFVFSTEVMAQSRSLPNKIALPKLQGGRIDGDDLEGKYVLMQFWASWCVTCGPAMRTFTKWTGDKKNLLWLPVNVDETSAEAKSYFKGTYSDLTKAQQLTAFDRGGRFAEKIGVSAVPMILLVAPDGRIVRQTTGHPTPKELREFEALMKRGNS